MRTLIASAILLMVAGCTQYARVGDLRQGMPASEVEQKIGPLPKTEEGVTQYRVWLKSKDTAAVEPYILTFESGKLADIRKDYETLLEDKGDIWSGPPQRAIPMPGRRDYRYQW